MPTIRGIIGPYRFYFYSFDCIEPMHVHVERDNAICKFWLGPLALAANDGFGAPDLSRVRRIIIMNRDRITEAWRGHCGGRK